jgi:hypothetical protein
MNKKEKMNGTALCDLDQIDAMGLYMELEAIEIQIEAAILHLSKAQELLAAPVVKDMAAVAAGKEPVERPVSDHSTRAFISGMMTTLSMQANLAAQVVLDVRMACADIAPNCTNVPSIVN